MGIGSSPGEIAPQVDQRLAKAHEELANVRAELENERATRRALELQLTPLRYRIADAFNRFLKRRVPPLHRMAKFVTVSCVRWWQQGRKAKPAQLVRAGENSLTNAHPQQAMPSTIPMPPIKLRTIVGPTDPVFYDNPGGDFIYPSVPPHLYESVFDFGCGCGRVARQLMLQRESPRRYLGIDANREMVEWCQHNLTPLNPAFHFEHHDVFSKTCAPENSPNRTLPICAPDGAFSLIIAHSIFTHLLQDQTEFYLRELRRLLRPDGMIRSTWFFFYRQDFPVLADHQNTLFVNENDPAQAVYYDYGYFLREVASTALRPAYFIPPQVKNFQWEVFLVGISSPGR